MLTIQCSIVCLRENHMDGNIAMNITSLTHNIRRCMLLQFHKQSRSVFTRDKEKSGPWAGLKMDGPAPTFQAESKSPKSKIPNVCWEGGAGQGRLTFQLLIYWVQNS